ncbi:MAG: alcohol dehydrogenase catalytic domain-containing protein [candidate division KSB1 bacterium]|nr:alcohol dehydrogenase catalytic domain-containing protein [candidate division KSB1 bacterium]MDZ7341152.1 alcohol dehydrogenase catalytic domain-containing protein [candidate division KSB1 bacterium]
MKAALLTGIRQFEIQQVPNPEITQDSDVFIRVKMVGVCGSDIHYYTHGRIGSQIVQFPFIIGHEAAGVVERIGKEVTRVKPGQRVAIDPAVSCGLCDQCRAGRENTCRKLMFLGNPQQLPGALCEFMVLPERCCYPISDSLTFEQAVLSEPLAIAVYSVARSQLRPNASVAILGVGPIGMSVFYVLRMKNVGEVYVTDKIQERLEFSQQLNPRWCGNPDRSDVVKEISNLQPLLMDVVYECSGDPAAFDQAIKLLKPGGALVAVGIPELDEIPIPIHELRRKEITIINIRRQAHCTKQAIDLLEQRQINLDEMATHHFQLEETGLAFELVSDHQDGVIKAMISVD